ncbi:unnamed protein product [Alopecurus aequalis]
MLGNFEKLLKQIDNRARFLSGVLSGDIKCINRKKNELRQEFVEKGFDPLPREVQPVVAIGATGVKKETEERPGVGASDYDYLTSMSVGSLDEEYLQHLLELKRRLEIKVGLLRKAAPQCLKSEKESTLFARTYNKAESDRDVMVHMAAKGSVSEAAPMRQRKRTAVDSLEASAVLMDHDEEEAPELKDQSQEHTETECSPKQEQNNQKTRRKKRRKEASETVARTHYRRALDFQGHEESGDGFLVDEIKRIASGLDGIEITRRNRDQSIVAHELAKLSLLPMSCPNDD